MRLAHQLTKNAEVAGFESAHGALRAVVFGNHVVASRIHLWVQKRTVLFQLGESYIAERADFWKNLAQGSNGFLAVGATAIVFARGKFVLQHRIADHKCDAGGQLHRLVLERTAIEKQRMRSAALASYKLIHDAAPRADEFVFGLLTHLRQLQAVDVAA